MKVIKKGSSWKQEVECTGKGNLSDNGKKGIVPCGAKLEIGARDIFGVKSGGNGIYSTYSYDYSFKCPCCGAKTDIERDLLPEEVKLFAQGRTEEDIDNEKKYSFAEEEEEREE